MAPRRPSVGRLSAMVILGGMTHRVGPKGQVVIPKELRDELGIEPGDEVSFWLHGDHVAVRPAGRARVTAPSVRERSRSRLAVRRSTEITTRTRHASPVCSPSRSPRRRTARRSCPRTRSIRTRGAVTSRAPWEATGTAAAAGAGGRATTMNSVARPETPPRGSAGGGASGASARGSWARGTRNGPAGGAGPE